MRSCTAMASIPVSKTGNPGSSPGDRAMLLSSSGQDLCFSRRGHGFESHREYHIQMFDYARVAQLAEQLTLNQKVEGSIPSACTNICAPSPSVPSAPPRRHVPLRTAHSPRFAPLTALCVAKQLFRNSITVGRLALNQEIGVRIPVRSHMPL